MLFYMEANALQQDIPSLVDFKEMAAAQYEDPELLQTLSSSSSLALEPIPLQMSACDTSTGVPHLFILIKFCCTMFHSLPSLSLILEYKPLNTSSLLGMFGTMMLGGGLNVPRYNDILLRHSPHLQTLMDNRLNLFSGDTLCNF